MKRIINLLVFKRLNLLMGNEQVFLNNGY